MLLAIEKAEEEWCSAKTGQGGGVDAPAKREHAMGIPSRWQMGNIVPLCTQNETPYHCTRARPVPPEAYGLVECWSPWLLSTALGVGVVVFGG